jgi:hypothetical protein
VSFEPCPCPQPIMLRAFRVSSRCGDPLQLRAPQWHHSIFLESGAGQDLRRILYEIILYADSANPVRNPAKPILLYSTFFISHFGGAEKNAASTLESIRSSLSLWLTFISPSFHFNGTIFFCRPQLLLSSITNAFSKKMYCQYSLHEGDTTAGAFKISKFVKI